MRSTAPLPSLVVLLILVAGCTGAPPAGDARTTDTTTTTTETTTEMTTQPTTNGTPLAVEGEILPNDNQHTQKLFPDPPAELTPTVAVRVARQYEEAYLYRYFSNRTDVESFGLYGTVTSEEAEIVNRTDAGYYVRVRHPFSYSTGRSQADGASHTRYLVNTTAIRRVSADYPD